MINQATHTTNRARQAEAPSGLMDTESLSLLLLISLSIAISLIPVVDVIGINTILGIVSLIIILPILISGIINLILIIS